MRQFQRWLAALIAAAVAAPFLLAGAGAFGAISFSAHIATGWSIAVLSPARPCRAAERMTARHATARGRI